MNLLIYDSIYSNHLYDYIDLIIRNLTFNKRYNEVHIILNSKFFEEYKHELNEISRQQKVHLHIKSLPIEVEIKVNSAKSIILKSIIEERFISDYCTKNGIGSVLLLYLDYFQIALGLRTFFYGRNKIIFSGVLFASFFYQRRIIKRISKWLQLRISLMNSELKNIFILNDYELVLNLNSKFRTSIFNYLPDPIVPIENKDFYFRKENNFDKDDFLFVSLGSVTRRKNVHNIIKALELFPDSYLKNTRFLICGSFDDLEYKQEILSLISNRIKKNVIIIDKFLEKKEFHSIIADSNCVCTAYIDFFGSSGIVGNAANFKKLVLASDNGTIGYIVKKFKLGVTVDVTSFLSISNGMQKIINHQETMLEKAIFDEYLLSSSPENFYKELLH